MTKENRIMIKVIIDVSAATSEEVQDFYTFPGVPELFSAIRSGEHKISVQFDITKAGASIASRVCANGAELQAPANEGEYKALCQSALDMPPSPLDTLPNWRYLEATYQPSELAILAHGADAWETVHALTRILDVDSNLARRHFSIRVVYTLAHAMLEIGEEVTRSALVSHIRRQGADILPNPKLPVTAKGPLTQISNESPEFFARIMSTAVGLLEGNAGA